MQSVFRSPWLAVSLVIAGMVAGYALELHTGGATAAAGSTCPYKEACKDGNCDGKDCAKGACKGGGCPGCNKAAQS